jgi:hypothetical protein
VTTLEQFRSHRERAWRAGIGAAVFGLAWKSFGLFTLPLAQFMQAVSLFCFATVLYQAFAHSRLASQKLDELLDQIKDLKAAPAAEAEEEL